MVRTSCIYFQIAVCRVSRQRRHLTQMVPVLEIFPPPVPDQFRKFNRTEESVQYIGAYSKKNIAVSNTETGDLFIVEYDPVCLFLGVVIYRLNTSGIFKIHFFTKFGPKFLQWSGQASADKDIIEIFSPRFLQFFLDDLSCSFPVGPVIVALFVSDQRWCQPLRMVKSCKRSLAPQAQPTPVYRMGRIPLEFYRFSFIDFYLYSTICRASGACWFNKRWFTRDYSLFRWNKVRENLLINFTIACADRSTRCEGG